MKKRLEDRLQALEARLMNSPRNSSAEPIYAPSAFEIMAFEFDCRRLNPAQAREKLKRVRECWGDQHADALVQGVRDPGLRAKLAG